MSKRGRQYVGLLSAIMAYYIIHEGAHFIYSLLVGTFKKINIMGLGVQIDIYREKMSDTQLAIFCLVGSVATLIVGYILVLQIERICKISSKVCKACMYYITIALLLLDPLYLSLLCCFFGGGDMNGISLVCGELIIRSVYGGILILNLILFAKVVLPKYRISFEKEILILK